MILKLRPNIQDSNPDSIPDSIPEWYKTALEAVSVYLGIRVISVMWDQTYDHLVVDIEAPTCNICGGVIDEECAFIETLQCPDEEGKYSDEGDDILECVLLTNVRTCVCETGL